MHWTKMFTTTLLSTAMLVQAQSNPTILLSDASKDISINTADNYSLKTRTEIFRFKNAIAAEIAKIIDPSLSYYGRILINEELNGLIITEEQEKLANILKVCEELDSEELRQYRHIFNEKIEMKYNKASEIMHLVSDYLSIEGKIQADDNFNMLIVSDNKYSIEKIREKVAEYDQPQRQIVIDLEIVEIEKSGLAENGIDWDEILAASWMAFSGSYGTISASSSLFNGGKKGDASKDGINLDGGISVNDVRDIIRVMQSDGYASVLSTPKVITLSGKRADLWYGKDIVYPYQRNNDKDLRWNSNSGIQFSNNRNDYIYADSSQDYGYQTQNFRLEPNAVTMSGNNNSDLRFDNERTAGLELSITPYVGESEIVKIDLDCELTNIIGWSQENHPIVSGQEINNSILAQKNQSILIGGLKRTKTIDVTKRIPGLGHILPFLFSRKTKEEVETEIAIFITPRIFDLNEMKKENHFPKPVLKKEEQQKRPSTKETSEESESKS